MLECCPDRRPAVLVVDDDPAVLRFMTLALSDLCDVISAGDALEAMLTIESYPGPIDLLVSDWHLPFCDGTELGLRFRQRRPGKPVLLVSGEPFGEPLPPGFEEFPKPFTAQILRERVRQVLSPAN